MDTTAFYRLINLLLLNLGNEGMTHFTTISHSPILPFPSIRAMGASLPRCLSLVTWLVAEMLQ